jgi:hypothetical protein
MGFWMNDVSALGFGTSAMIGLEMGVGFYEAGRLNVYRVMRLGGR